MANDGFPREGGLTEDARELVEPFEVCFRPDAALFLGMEGLAIDPVCLMPVCPGRARDGIDFRFCTFGGAIFDFGWLAASSCFDKETCDVLGRNTGNFEGRGRPDGLFTLAVDESISVKPRTFCNCDS